MQAKPMRLPRRAPVPRNRGIYYRPRPGGKVAPPYEIRYLDSGGTYRWVTVNGSLEEAQARRSELMIRRRRGERTEPNRQRFDEYARAWLERQEIRPRTREVYNWALERHLIPYFGRHRLDQISCDEIAAFITLKRRAGLKGWTVTSILRPQDACHGPALQACTPPRRPTPETDPELAGNARTSHARGHR